MPRMVLNLLTGCALLLLIAVLPLMLMARAAPSLPALIAVDGARDASFPDGRIRYQDEGSGPDATVFLHGFNGQLGGWNGTWAAGTTCGRRLRLDIPGYGGSDWRGDDYGLAAQARRVIALLDARGIERATLVGTSMGGSLAAYIAAYYPQRVTRLALLAPSGYTGSLRYHGVFGLMTRPGPVNAAARGLAATALFRRLFPRSRALQAASVTASYGPAWVAALGRIEAPTLIAWSRGDVGVSHTTALDVRNAIRGSALLWLDAATGHLIPQERAELVAALACRLAAGASPAEAVRTLPPGLLRAGEGLAP